MGKHEAGSAKALSVAMKAKGLQKVRFYCQVCEKQCRDENGFKCHTTSEAHLRKMQIFSANSKKYLDTYSEQFEKGFLDILSRRHNTKRMGANVVYNEYIQDKHHIHMNATQWTSLTQFVQYLGTEHKCVVEEVGEQWYVTWIDRDAPLARDAAEKKRRHDADDEERRRRDVLRQVEAAAAGSLGAPAPDAAPVDPQTATLATALKLAKGKRRRLAADGDDEDDDVDGVKQHQQQHQCGKQQQDEGESKGEGEGEEEAAAPGNSGAASGAASAAVSAAASCAASAAASRVAGAAAGSAGAASGVASGAAASAAAVAELFESPVLAPGTWLVPGIVVKVVSSKVGGGLFKRRKGVVLKVAGKEALLRMLDNPDEETHAEEAHLETVLPDLGQLVLIVSRKASFEERGALARLVNVDMDAFKATVRLPSGAERRLEYENICKWKGGPPRV